MLPDLYYFALSNQKPGFDMGSKSKYCISWIRIHFLIIIGDCVCGSRPPILSSGSLLFCPQLSKTRTLIRVRTQNTVGVGSESASLSQLETVSGFRPPIQWGYKTNRAASVFTITFPPPFDFCPS